MTAVDIQPDPPPVQQAWADVENPYPGPQAFEDHDRRPFCGRRTEAAELSSLIRARPCVLMYAPSGAGKTSLLNASVLPGLEEHGFEIIGPLRVDPSAIVESRITWKDRSVVPNVYAAAAIGSAEKYRMDYADISLAGWLASHLDRLEAVHGGDGPPRTVVVFDQFEEILEPFERSDWPTARLDFIDQLAAVAEDHPDLHLLFAIREEHLAAIQRLCRRLPTARTATFRLELLGLAEAKQAIVEPAEATGVVFAPLADGERLSERVERVIDDDGDRTVAMRLLQQLATKRPAGFSEPIPVESVDPAQLQVACRRLWSDAVAAADGQTPTIQDVGKVEDALRSHVETATKGVTRGHFVPRLRLLNFLNGALITPRRTRKLHPRSGGWLHRKRNARLERLEHTYGLIRSVRRSGTRYWELSHDGFIAPLREERDGMRKTGMAITVGFAFVVALVVPAIWGGDEPGPPTATIQSISWDGTRLDTDELVSLVDGDESTYVSLAQPAGETGHWRTTLTVQFDAEYELIDAKVDPGVNIPTGAWLNKAVSVRIGEEAVATSSRYGTAQKVTLTLSGSSEVDEIHVADLTFWYRPT